MTATRRAAVSATSQELPSWQAGSRVPRSINEGGRIGRGVPDMSGNADPDTGYLIGDGVERASLRRHERGRPALGGARRADQPAPRRPRRLSQSAAVRAPPALGLQRRPDGRERRVPGSPRRVGRLHRPRDAPRPGVARRAQRLSCTRTNRRVVPTPTVSRPCALRERPRNSRRKTRRPRGGITSTLHVKRAAATPAGRGRAAHERACPVRQPSPRPRRRRPRGSSG